MGDVLTLPAPTDDQLDWQADAVCRGANPALFFPERGESVKPAKATCAGCPVRTECLTYALDHSIKYGIWGGASEKERRSMRRQRNEVSAA